MNECRCDFCGNTYSDEDLQYFDSKWICKDCYKNNTCICNDCGERIWKCEAYEAGNNYYCQRCFDDNFFTCNRCGVALRLDDAYYLDDDEDEPYCRECQDILENAPIHDYNYKPQAIFYGNNDMYMGIELEIDGRGEYSENAETLAAIANFNAEHVYCKHDGSLDDGFEIVSHPMTLKYHMEKMPWEKLFETAVNMGYRSHETTTCGLHIHVNRSYFGNTYDEQEAVIARIIYFVEAHWNELLKFSRRTEGSIMRWASRYGIEENTQLTYNKAKKGNTGR